MRRVVRVLVRRAVRIVLGGVVHVAGAVFSRVVRRQARVTSSLPPRAPVLQALIDICGPDFARHAGADDAIAGRMASFVVSPATTESLAAVVRLAQERGLALIPRGAGTKIDWGRPPSGVDLLVDTARMAGVWAHRPGGVTAEVGAGTPVRALQAAFALRGQRLAVDPRSPGATVGGMLAVNETGPLRHRFGSPADQIDVVTYVDQDGVHAESDGEQGRPGIGDIAGVIVSARVRLKPLPAARRWVWAAVSTPLRVPAVVGEALAAAEAPSAVEVDLPTPQSARTREQPPGTLAILVEGDPKDVMTRADVLAGAIGEGATVSEIAPPWWGRYPFGPHDVALRVSTAVEDLPAVVYALRDAAGQPVPVRGSVGPGDIHAVLSGSLGPNRVTEILESLRHVLLARGGQAAIIMAPPEIAEHIEMAGRRELF